MKYWCLLFFLPLLLAANDEQLAFRKVGGVDPEKSEFYQNFKKLVKQKCAGKFDDTGCIQRELKNLSPAQLKQLSAGVTPHNIKNIHVEKGSGDNLLRESLKEGLHKKIFGAELGSSVTEQEFFDHGHYYKLWENTFNEGVLRDLYSYCLIRYNPNGPDFKDKDKKRMDRRVKEIQSKGVLKVAKQFQNCYISIAKNCRKDEKAYSYACATKAKLEDREKVLMALEKFKEKGFDTASGIGFAIANTFKQKGHYTGKEKDRSLRDIAHITSAEVLGDLNAEDSFKSSYQKQVARIKEICQQDATSEQCLQYFQTDQKDFKKMQQEYEGRTLLALNQIDNIDELSDGDNSLASYLRKQGKSEEYINQAIKKYKERNNHDEQKTLGELKKKIIDDTKKERDAIIANLVKSLDKQKIDPNTKTLTNLNEILEELEDQPERLAALTHYGNIVSGFLQISTNGQDFRQNTFSLARELASSSYEGTPYFEQLRKDTNDAIKSYSAEENQGTVSARKLLEQILNI